MPLPGTYGKVSWKRLMEPTGDLRYLPRPYLQVHREKEARRRPESKLLRKIQERRSVVRLVTGLAFRLPSPTLKPWKWKQVRDPKEVLCGNLQKDLSKS